MRAGGGGGEGGGRISPYLIKRGAAQCSKTTNRSQIKRSGFHARDGDAQNLRCGEPQSTLPPRPPPPGRGGYGEGCMRPQRNCAVRTGTGAGTVVAVLWSLSSQFGACTSGFSAQLRFRAPLLFAHSICWPPCDCWLSALWAAGLLERLARSCSPLRFATRALSDLRVSGTPRPVTFVCACACARALDIS